MPVEFSVQCPYCHEQIEIYWEVPSAAHICDFCEHTFWIRPNSNGVYEGFRMKVSGCCGGG
jgi:hypothetical protein